MLDTILKRIRAGGADAVPTEEDVAEAQRAVDEARARQAELEAGRGAALLAGGERERAHEAALVVARQNVERLEALKGALAEKMSAAALKARRAEVKRQIQEAEQAAAKAAEAMRREYPQLARRLAELLADEARAEYLIAQLVAVIVPAERDGLLPSDFTGVATPRQRYAPSPGMAQPPAPLWRQVRLPPLSGGPLVDGTPNHWPHEVPG